MPEFSIINIISHQSYVVNDDGPLGVVYDMIIGCDVMVQLGLLNKSKCQVLQWDGVTSPRKQPRSLLYKSYLTSCKMQNVVMKTSENV